MTANIIEYWSKAFKGTNSYLKDNYTYLSLNFFTTEYFKTKKNSF